MTLHSNRWLAPTLALAAGCTPAVTPTPAPRPTPAPTTPPPTPAPIPSASSAPIRFVYGARPAEYDDRTESTIELTSGPEAERGRETVSSAGHVSYVVAPTARGATITGQVDGFAVQASARVSGGVTDPPVSVRFRSTVDGRGATVERDGAGPGCAAPTGGPEASALAAARETILRVPTPLASGARWRDSVVVATCRSQLPATVTTVTRFEVVGIDGSTVRLRRQATTTVRGQGIAGGRSVSMSGAGTEDATLELDAARGRLVRVDGEGRSTITVSLPDGSRQFDQRSKLTVRSRP
jgi:hypothetical protein